MNSNKFEIMFEDLNEKSQKEVLKFLRIKDPKEMNLDIVPLATIESDTESSEVKNNE